MRSNLLEGTVRHARARPFKYGLAHSVFYVALDLAELDEVARSRAADQPESEERAHVPRFGPLRAPRRDLPAAVATHLRDEGFDSDGWRITLITNLRVLGYVFNPASFYLCRDEAGTLRVVIVEVHNTHHERHLYTLRPDDDGLTFTASMDKAFYVSPFIESVGRYSVRVRDEASRVRISIDEARDGEPGPAHAPGPDTPAPDRPDARPDAPAPPVHHPAHDRADPLARAAIVASRRAVPSARRGRTMSLPGAVTHLPSVADSIIGRARPPDLSGGRRPDPSGPVDRGHARRIAAVFGDAASAEQAEIRIHDREAYVRLLLHGETGAGEAYMDGLWSSPDLAGLIKLAARNREALALSSGRLRALTQVPRTLAHRARRNTVGQSRRNISAHYDLGNDFYRLFLDESLTYSSAVFATPDQSLADAQRNKYRLIAEGAGLTRGQHVLEIGTGWGGFALYAAGELGCRVTSVTISREQFELATERVHAAGLDDLVDIQLRDYREISGTYDAVVSIEMIEAVGARILRDVLRSLRRRARAGRADEPAGHHLPGRRVRSATTRCQLDPDVHLSGRPVSVAGGDRAVDP